ncbi:MAG: hypothetical protein EF806_01860 [Candidatus Methanoliparum thermophilum]|uniref:Uncharacterized protein n=1 Tax=Methanoliparum thermophilum TaxID=2491083 RepID=A0A520KSU2_METT2|nr:hypothetical protein [Candidatus Methanoliparum sp. LAM-1]RZN64820.1 MAG: hypothetical protein EF806_01860 [Candidatus Methanoliparum thermophilum]BDC36310.1 hypothetical protein MTLP_09920 [Candidatus Methanoliparum sp. LAM-1]
MEEIRIEKPTVDEYKGRRKIIYIPLIHTWEDAPIEYTELVKGYWNEVREQLKKLTAKLGGVDKIYHEFFYSQGENELSSLKEINENSYDIIKKFVITGAKLIQTEDKDISEACIDWERCLTIGLINNEVRSKVSEFYIETSNKRYRFVAEMIDKTLGEDEIGIIFFGENHRIPFSEEIEVFNLTPRKLDDIHNWFRDNLSKMQSLFNTKK